MLPKKRTLLVMLMFLIGLLAPAGWIATLATASAPSTASQPLGAHRAAIAPQPDSQPLGWCIDLDRHENRLPTLGQNEVGLQNATTPLTGATTIGDFVWDDENGNGIQDNGEPGVEDVICVLCKRGQMDPIATTTTNIKGLYTFEFTDTLRMAGSDEYYVIFQSPVTYTFTTGDVNGNDHDIIDSDVITLISAYTGRTDYFTVTAGTDNSWDAGLIYIGDGDPPLSELSRGSQAGSDLVVEPASLSSRQTAEALDVTNQLSATPIISATATPISSNAPTSTPTRRATSPHRPSNASTVTNRSTVTNSATRTNAMCGPMDVVFALDETGSMRELLNDVPLVTFNLLNQIDMLSGGDYQLGLLTFQNIIEVDVDLGIGNEDQILASAATLNPFEGQGEPEASAEALNTVINGLDAGSSRPEQIGDFNGAWRLGAAKMIILVTDAPPGGFDDAYEVGVDDVNAQQRASEASNFADGTIAISAIELGADPTTEAIMSHYANETGGFYMQPNDGNEVLEDISTIINNCGTVPTLGYNLYLPAIMKSQ